LATPCATKDQVEVVEVVVDELVPRSQLATTLVE
jgi:hypothetical protein